MSAHWRRRELVVESLRNLRAAPVTTLLVVVVIVASVAAGTVLEATEARRGRTQVAARTRDGGWVTVARSAAGIDAAACRRLAGQHQVLASGGVEKPASVAVSSAPGTLFEAYPATAEFTDVLLARSRPAVPTGLAVVGAALATELGLVDGSQIEVAERGRFSILVLPASVRADRFDRALIVPELPGQPGRLEECWVEWVPGTNDVRTLTESLLAAGAPLNVSATLTASAYSQDPFAQYAERWTRWWFVAVGLVTALVVAIGLRARRRAMALYTAVGASRSELVTLYGIEALLIAILGTVGGVAWGLAVFAGPGNSGGEMTTFDVGTALRQALFVPACITLITVLVLSTRRFNVAEELKAE